MGNFADRSRAGAGIEQAKVSKTGLYFKVGKYRVKINAVRWIKASVGAKEFVVIETEVLESNNNEVPVGAERSQVIDMTGVMGMSNVKGFVAAISGVDSSSSNLNEQIEAYWAGLLGSPLPLSDICDMICSEANPLGGEEIDLECVEVTKRDGDPFTKHMWATRSTQ
jgi:hypothetical protein